MSWAIPGWKRQIDSFHLVLGYGEAESDVSKIRAEDGSSSLCCGVLGAGSTEGQLVVLKSEQPVMVADKNDLVQVAAVDVHGNFAGTSPPSGEGAGLMVGSLLGVINGGLNMLAKCKYHVQLDWMVGEDEDVVTLRLQSQIMAMLPLPGDQVEVMFQIDNKGQVAGTMSQWLPEEAIEPTALGCDPHIQRLPSLQGWVDVPGLHAECANMAPAQMGLDCVDGLPQAQLVETMNISTTSGSGQGEWTSMCPGSLQMGGAGEPTMRRWLPVKGEVAGYPRVQGAEVGQSDAGVVRVQFRVRRFREPLRVVLLSRKEGGGVPMEKVGLLSKILDPGYSDKVPKVTVAEELLGYTHNWRSLMTLDLSGCLLLAVPPEIVHLVMLEQLFLDNNRLTFLPSEVGRLTSLRILRADHNLLTTVPVELRQCVQLVELSLAYNRLVRPLLDFSAMHQLQALYLSGNPLEFFPEILPCTMLRHLSLANVRIESDDGLSSVGVAIEAETPSYFAASKHKLSTFFALIFRYPSVQHPLLASALARLAEDVDNRSAIGKDDQAIRQILSMLLSDKNHVVEQGCLALSSLAADPALAARLLKADVVNSVQSVMRVETHEILVSVVRLVANIAFSSNAVAVCVLTHTLLKRIVELCRHSNCQVQTQALLAVGNLAFCTENRRVLLAVEGFRDELLTLAVQGRSDSSLANGQLGLVPGRPPEVCRAAMRALAIFGENDYVCKAVSGRAVGKRGVRILAMDGGGMRGMATVRMLRRLEQGVGRPIHEIFDLICGTSTGGMLAVALGVKQMKLDQCEEIYKNLGKLVFAEPVAKDEQAATWRDKLDQMYKSGTQNLRIVVHGSKHQSEEFERLLMEMCADPAGNLLIDSAVKGGPKVFVVSTLVSVTPAQPFLFRNYQYPPGTPEPPHIFGDGTTVVATSAAASPTAASVFSPATAGRVPGQPQRLTFMGSCKHQVWEAIRASSAAPYYLDDFFSGEGRWQDGAVVANNPALVALREARLLWPDRPIDCLLSFGCGNVPCKPRGKGNWRFLDSGQVLIESACTVERTEETLDTLAPLIPELRYWRFNPIDDRCGMELDETDPSVWAKLEAATQEYVNANDSAFEAACQHLAPSTADKDVDNDSCMMSESEATTSESGVGVSLGWRRKILLVEGRRSPDVQKLYRHTILLQTSWRQQNIKFEHYDLTSKQPEQTNRASGNFSNTWDVGTVHEMTSRPGTSGSCRSSPRTGQGIPSSPASRIVYPAPDRGVGIPRVQSSPYGAFCTLDHRGVSSAGHMGRTSWEVMWDRALLGVGVGRSSEERRSSRPVEHVVSQNEQGSEVTSPPWSPMAIPQVAHHLGPAASDLHDYLVRSTSTGVVHLALHSDADGLILCWKNDVISVAEPGEMAAAFVAEATASIRTQRETVQANATTPRDHAPHSLRISSSDILPPNSHLSELVASFPRFTVGGALHCFIGRHTQVLTDGREVGAYLFRRTRPADRLSAKDIHWMAGAWQERLVVCSGLSHGPPGLWVLALLEAGAKGVVIAEYEKDDLASSQAATLSMEKSLLQHLSDAEGSIEGHEHSATSDEMDNANEAAAERQTGQVAHVDGSYGDDGKASENEDNGATKAGEGFPRLGKQLQGETLNYWSNTDHICEDGAIGAGLEAHKRGRKKRDVWNAAFERRLQDDSEAEKGAFWSVFYDELLHHGSNAIGALKTAQELHPRVGRHRCYTKSQANEAF